MIESTDSNQATANRRWARYWFLLFRGPLS